MARSEEFNKLALNGKKIPILTLDHKWHQLFTQAQAEISGDIKRMEEKLNELIKRQGKLNTESKDIHKLKKKLMGEIMELSHAVGSTIDPRVEKKMEDNRRLINECNELLETYKEELYYLPKEIESINHKLMLITMDVCYEKINLNTREITNIKEWLDSVRVEIKKNVIRKEEREKENFALYSYMHDIFGADVIEIFDMKFHPEGQMPEENRTDSDDMGFE